MSYVATGNYKIKSVRKLDVFEEKQRYLITTKEDNPIVVFENNNTDHIGQNIDATGWSKIQTWVSQGNTIGEAE